MRPHSPTIPALAFLVLIAAMGIAPAGAGEVEDAHEYQTCMALARTKPDDGLEEAMAWRSMGGGEPAEHCLSVALMGQGKYAEAAERLEKLAQASKRDNGVRAGMLQQAAQGWLMAGDANRADAAQRTALKLNPGNVDLLLDHALTMAQVHHYKEAVSDLSDVLRRQPQRIEALTMRASAYRYLDDRKAAEADITRALEIDPGYPDALVERGILRRLNGDESEAREDWLKVVRTVPQGPALDEAQRNLELLDVRTK